MTAEYVKNSSSKKDYSTLEDFLKEVNDVGELTQEEFENFMKPVNHEGISIDDISEESMEIANKSTIQFIESLRDGKR